MGSMAEELFSETLQKTQVWLDELGDELDWDHPAGLLAALRAALHSLRDRLTPAEAAQLGAQLPLLIRGIYYDGWRPAAQPWKERHAEGFVARVEHELGGYAELREPERVESDWFAAPRHESGMERAACPCSRDTTLNRVAQITCEHDSGFVRIIEPCGASQPASARGARDRSTDQGVPSVPPRETPRPCTSQARAPQIADRRSAQRGRPPFAHTGLHDSRTFGWFGRSSPQGRGRPVHRRSSSAHMRPWPAVRESRP